MGACTFMVRARGATAEEAFSAAVYQAQHEYGHGGYTGTIAEKHSFILIPVPEEEKEKPIKFAKGLLYQDDEMDQDYEWLSDKWGPAGCVKLQDGTWLFFGWASE